MVRRGLGHVSSHGFQQLVAVVAQRLIGDVFFHGSPAVVKKQPTGDVSFHESLTVVKP